MEALLAKKIRSSSYYSDHFETCVQNFVLEKLAHNETLQKAFDLTAQEMEVAYAEAYNYYQADDYLKACEQFRMLTILNPFEPKYWIGLGASQQLLGNYQAALEAYAVHVFLDSNNPYPHFYAYQCLMVQQELDEAKKALAKARELTARFPFYGELRKKIAEA